MEQAEIGSHRRLEQLVQTVRPLHELKRYADQKELLQLLDNKAIRADSINNGRHERTRSDHDVKDVPSISAEAAKPETEPSDDDVYDVD